MKQGSAARTTGIQGNEGRVRKKERRSQRLFLYPRLACLRLLVLSAKDEIESAWQSIMKSVCQRSGQVSGHATFAVPKLIWIELDKSH